MIPDISLEDCITMVSMWFSEAIEMRDATGDFEYTIEAHRYNQIKKHLVEYQRLKEKCERPLGDRLVDILREVRDEK